MINGGDVEADGSCPHILSVFVCYPLPNNSVLAPYQLHISFLFLPAFLSLIGNEDEALFVKIGVFFLFFKNNPTFVH